MGIPLRDNAPSYAVPQVTILLIAVNVLVFIIQHLYPGGFLRAVYLWGEIPTRILAGEFIPGTHIPSWVTVLTSMFMHADFWHIFGNMLALWLFGDNMEWLLGRAKFLLFYLLSGVGASLVTVFLGYESDLPGIGASGAIAGVMMAYLIFYPRARITSLVWFDPFSIGHLATGRWGLHLRNISSIWYIGSWVALQLALAGVFIGAQMHINLGIYAHAGGAVIGAIIVWPFLIRERVPPADSPVRTAPFTMPFWGDEGGAVEGDVYVEVDLREPATLRKIRSFKLPFHDSYVDEFLANGDIDGALAHVCDMLRIARQQDDTRRIAGYEQIIRELREERQSADREPSSAN